MSVLDEIYESEINCRISSDWDGGWTAELGDERNGFTDRADGLRTIAEVEAWLTDIVCKRFPDSDFARRRRKT